MDINEKLNKYLEYSNDKLKFECRDKVYIEGLIDLILFLKKECICDKMVEVGSYAGLSTCMFSEIFDNVTSVDDFSWAKEEYTTDYIYSIYRERTSKRKNISLLKEKSTTAHVFIPNDFVDFLYIDGDHSYQGVKTDLKLFVKKVKTGGYVGGHDYCKDFPGVEEAIKEYFGKDVNINIFKDTSWLIQKL